MARAIWTGSISFGLVNIPVKMYTAVSPKSIRFHLLHDADGARIKQKRVCAADQEEVAPEHLIKGYEISKGRYVPIMPEELEALDPKATHTIDILDFVPIEQIDPIYFEKPYYVVPDRGSVKAYALLKRAMEAGGKVAVARVVMRTKQYTVALRPLEKALSISTLFYADEIVDEGGLEGLPETDVELPARELTMAEQLIESLSTDFEPARYRDEYRDRVLELIRKKADGQELVTPPAEPAAPKVIDLMAALEASLAKTAKTKEKGAKPRGKRRAAGG
jgi:DNA end-binding protein Ku